MDKNSCLKSDKIELFPASEEDIPYIMHLEGAPENAHGVVPWERKRHIEAQQSMDKREFVIRDVATGESVGFVIIDGLDDPHENIHIKRLVVDKKNAGYGTALFCLLMKCVFEQMERNRLWLEVKEHNTAAKKLYESLGFVQEGFFRESCRERDGTFTSYYILSMLRRDYLRGKACP